MTVHVHFTDGGDAAVMETDGVRVILRSSRPAPPGAPLEAELTLSSPHVLRLKVRECRKNEDGSFLVRARWVNLPRTVRDELVRASSGTCVG